MNSAEFIPVMKLMITIVDRGKSDTVAELLLRQHLPFNFTCLGFGTANSDILDYLGLGETDKDVIVSIVPESKIQELFENVSQKMQLSKPGKGIIFTVPLSGIGKSAISALVQDELEKGVKKVEHDRKYDLILAIVNQGHVDEIMQVAKKAGGEKTGGTILHGRSIGYEEVEKFLGITINPEKELIAIIAPHQDKHSIMQSISQAAGVHSPSRGIIFSVPVHDVIGIGGMDKI